MIKNEKILGLVILGIILAATSVHAVQYGIQFEENKGTPMRMIEAFGNGTTRSFEVPTSSPHSVLIALFGILAALMKIVFALPFVIAGLGFIGGPMAFLHGNLSLSTDGLRVVVFLILSIISIPITFYISREIVFWRRIPYIYIITALISGIPILLSENFGR